MIELRRYQAECIDGIDVAFVGSRAALACLPTGAGKTVVFATLGRDWPDGRVLILAHREELVTQAADEVEGIAGERPDVEMASMVAYDRLYGGSKVVVGSIASVCRGTRLARFNPDDFGLVVVDEGHHCVAGNVMYDRTLRHFAQNPRTRFLLVTATADRGDKRLLSVCGETPALAYEYKLSQAIHDGYLVPIRQQFVTCESLDFSKVKSTRSGDLSDAGVAEVMEAERSLHEVVGPTLDLAGDRVTLIFAASIAHAERVSEIINRQRPGKAIAVHGGNRDYPMSPDARRGRLAALGRGEFQYLVGCDVFYEGFNHPPIACVAVARPTKSRARYAQAVGRGTRTLRGVLTPAMTEEERLAAIRSSGKPDVLVLDFVGAAGRLKLELASTLDLLAGDATPDVVRRAKAKAQVKGGGPVDPDEALEEAKAEIAAEERKSVVAKASYRAVDVDPFGHGGVSTGGGSGLKPGEKLATDAQCDFLRRRGVNASKMSRKQASAVIDKLRDAPTVNQLQALSRAGEDLSGMTARKASVLIELLKARGWRPRDYRLTRECWRLKRHADGRYGPVVIDSIAGRVELSWRCDTEEACRAFVGRLVESESRLFEAA